MSLLDVSNLSIEFNLESGILKAVTDLSFLLSFNETLCIVGESGCGKSVSAMAIMNLLKTPPANVNGLIEFNGRNITNLTNEEKSEILGNDISMIFQDPVSSLNPVFTCGYQIEESLIFHKKLSKESARKRAVELLDMVRIPEPHKRANAYPHELSGGMRQRVMIAMAISCEPKLLIADEPTTALDVTVQAQILSLIADMQKNLGMSVLFITHDLGIVSGIADRVMVMYSGEKVEEGSRDKILNEPRHPYTKGLIESIPSLDKRKEKLVSIDGSLPDPFSLPSGCRFYERCKISKEICKIDRPKPTYLSEHHTVYCYGVENAS